MSCSTGSAYNVKAIIMTESDRKTIKEYFAAMVDSLGRVREEQEFQKEHTAEIASKLGIKPAQLKAAAKIVNDQSYTKKTDEFDTITNLVEVAIR